MRIESKTSQMGAMVALSFVTTLFNTNAVVSAEPAKKDIVDTAAEAGSFNTLATAIGAADLIGALKGEGPFTVFAPTDEAFAKLPAGTVESLLKPENKEKLSDILTYHVVLGSVPANQVINLKGATTLNGQRIDIESANGNVTVDNARVVQTDIKCSNGIIHVIDEVILPASDDIPTTAVKAGSFQTLIAAAKAAGLVETLAGKGPLTVFAPTDEAFAKLPAGTVDALLKPENKGRLESILKFHVVAARVHSLDAISAGKAKTLEGQSVTISVKNGIVNVNGAALLDPDIDAINGVIHVIDSVLLPPETTKSYHPSTVNATNPRLMIEHAIAQGVPLYNSGHANRCAAIYMSTVSNLLTQCQISQATRHSLQTALTSAQRSHCSETQAWTLRHALDHAYNCTASIR